MAELGWKLVNGPFHVEQGAETAQEGDVRSTGRWEDCTVEVEDERLESLGLKVALMTCDGDGDGSAFLSNFKTGVCQFQSMFVASPASVRICVGLLGYI